METVTTVVNSVRAKLQWKNAASNGTTKEANGHNHSHKEEGEEKSALEIIEEPLDYNEVLKHLGQFGPWQMRIFFLLWLVSAYDGLVTVVFAFTGFVPNSRCAIPFCEHQSNSTYFADTQGNFAEYVQLGIPKHLLEDGNSCQYYGMKNLPNADPSHVLGKESCDFYLSELQRNSTDLELMSCTSDDLLFDTTLVEDSLVTIYGLTCDRKWIKSLLGAIFMVGVFIGSYVFGVLADKFGRMPAIMTGVTVTAVSGILGGFMSTSSGGFGFFRFLTGFGAKGLFMVAFVLAVEVIGHKFAAIVGIAMSIPFALGELVLGLEAYFVRDWKTLQLVAHAPWLALLILWFFLPESPRWLIATGETEKARNVVKQGARVNKRDIPVNVLHPGPKPKDQLEKEHQPLGTLDLFRPSVILWRSLNLSWQWFSVTFCYYGLSFSSTSLSGDPYLNFCLNVFIEIPGYIFALFVMDCWGRRPILSFCQAVSGVACILAGLLVTVPSLGALQLVLTLIGKFGSSAGFAIVYLYSAELFPTRLRTTAIGFFSVTARIGAILSFLVELMAHVWKPAPMIIMGGTAVVAGFMAARLPETVGQDLPDTMEDAINMNKRSNRGFLTCVCPKNLHEIVADS